MVREISLTNHRVARDQKTSVKKEVLQGQAILF